MCNKKLKSVLNKKLKRYELIVSRKFQKVHGTLKTNDVENVAFQIPSN